MKKLLACAAVFSAVCLLLGGCSSAPDKCDGVINGSLELIPPYGVNTPAEAGNAGGDVYYPAMSDMDCSVAVDQGYIGGYIHDNIYEQGFSSVSQNSSSYFSLDRNTATYPLVRSQIESGYKVQENSVRIEEMINYFD